jgi:hypothetical protein
MYVMPTFWSWQIEFRHFVFRHFGISAFRQKTLNPFSEQVEKIPSSLKNLKTLILFSSEDSVFYKKLKKTENTPRTIILFSSPELFFLQKVVKPKLKTGVDVMIAIFCDFWQFSAKILAFFTKTNVMIKILHNLASFWVKNAKFFEKIFGENI